MGRYMFMHNGMIGDFHKVRRKLLTKLGRRAFDFAVSKVLHHLLAALGNGGVVLLRISGTLRVLLTSTSNLYCCLGQFGLGAVFCDVPGPAR